MMLFKGLKFVKGVSVYGIKDEAERLCHTGGVRGITYFC